MYAGVFFVHGHYTKISSYGAWKLSLPIESLKKMATNLSVEAALEFVLDDECESEGEPLSSSDGGMSSDEESELDRDLRGELSEEFSEFEPEEDIEEEAQALQGDQLTASSGDSADEHGSADNPLDSTVPPAHGRGQRSTVRAPRRGRGAGRAAHGGQGGARGVRGAHLHGRGRGGGQGAGRGRGRGGAQQHASAWDGDADTQPVVSSFKPNRPPGFHPPEHFQPLNELSFFKLFFTAQVLMSIAKFTNAYADEHIAQGLFSSYANSEGVWSLATEQEILSLIACIIYMGIKPYPRLEHY